MTFILKAQLYININSIGYYKHKKSIHLIELLTYAYMFTRLLGSLMFSLGGFEVVQTPASLTSYIYTEFNTILAELINSPKLSRFGVHARSRLVLNAVRVSWSLLTLLTQHRGQVLFTRPVDYHNYIPETKCL